MTKEYNLSIRCHFGDMPGNYTQHYQSMKLGDIKKWVEAYKYTHPTVKSITVKIWLEDEQ